jgi:hypothetical protein
MLPSRLKFLRSLFHTQVHALQPLPPGDSPFVVKYIIIIIIIIIIINPLSTQSLCDVNQEDI